MAETSDAPPWEPPFSGTEVEHLLGALDRQRATFRWKADGRGRSGLTTTVGASTMTLGGLLKHLALVEDLYSSSKLTGEPLGEPWSGMPGFDPQADLEWTTAANDDPAFLYALYDGAVQRARERYATLIGRDGLDQRVHAGADRGLVVSLRRILFDMVEEYARHTGHADLLSEAVDGRFGEDPPSDWVPVGAVEDGEGHDPAVPRFEQRRMLGATFRMVDLTGAEFTYVDLDGARFQGANLRRVTIDGDLVDVRISAGDLEDVVVNDVDIAPLVNAELDRRDPDRPLAHPSEADGFRRGWDLLERRWAETVAHARTLAPEQLHASVDGEWSFIETLRHLVFATQAWVGRGVNGDPYPWHPLALPWDEVPDAMGLPRDREARPSLDEVLALRADARAMVRAVLEGLTDAQLDTVSEPVDAPGWPQGRHSVRDCLSAVLDEEYAHRRFAERDLAVLEGGGAAR